MDKALKSNIWKYIVFNVTSARVYMPIITLYLLSFDDVGIRLAGIILAIVQLSQFVLEVPSGYVADRIGHKNTLVITRVFFLLSSVFFLVGGLTFSLVGALCFGIGLAFVSGTLTAFMQGTIDALGKMHEYSKIIGNAQSIFLILSALLLIGVPATFAFNIRTPFLIALIFDVIGLFVTLSFVSPPKKKKVQEISTSNFWTIFREAKSRNLISVTVIISLLFALILGARTFQDAYQAAVGINIVYLGALFASSKVLSALIMRSPLYVLKDKLTFKNFSILISGILFLIILSLGLTENPVVIAGSFILSAGLLWGAAPIFDHYKLDLIKDSQNKASLLSLGGLTDSIFKAGASVGIGLLVGWAGFQVGYLYYVLLSIVLFIAIFLVLKHKRLLPYLH